MGERGGGKLVRKGDVVPCTDGTFLVESGIGLFEGGIDLVVGGFIT